MTSQIVPGAQRRLKNRVTLRMTISNSLTMAYRNILLIRRTPQQLFDVTIQPILFTLLFAFLFGGAISGSVTSYLPIIIPGILAQTALTATSATGVQLREDMDKGVFYRFKSMPIARIAPLTGPLLADIVRYAIATALTFVMGYLLGFRWASLAGAVTGGVLVVFCRWCISWIIGCSASSSRRRRPFRASLRRYYSLWDSSRARSCRPAPALVAAGLCQREPADLHRERHPAALQPGHHRKRLLAVADRVSSRRGHIRSTDTAGLHAKGLGDWTRSASTIQSYRRHQRSAAFSRVGHHRCRHRFSGRLRFSAC